MQIEKRGEGATLPAKLKDWRWRTQDDLMMRPCIMKTRHLHHTLVMIWHHTMPEEARVRPYYRTYSFAPFYTDRYMKQAIQVMANELASRSDMQPEWLEELRKMREYLRPTSGKIGAVRRIGKATGGIIL
jgi:hypothetical protein